MPPAKGAPAEPTQNGGQGQFGRYTLLKKLAAGGMAEVYLAKQTGIERFERMLVIKRILPNLSGDEEFVQMFLNEARIAARFNHANIVQIYDLGEANGTYFIAMEYIHGEDLGRIMRKAWQAGRWIPMPLAVRVVASTCEGLYYAHTKTDEGGAPLNVVHRDISPQNILVSFDGGVKLVDFGIARAASNTSGTKTGTLKGKYAYMSPEQAQGKLVDARTDIFALGLVLYELLTGVRPLKRENDLLTLQAASACEIEPPSKVASVDPNLDPVVMRALAPKREERYQTAREFQLALEDLLMQERLSASSAHLSDFMRELFADRLEEEARSGKPSPSTQSPSHKSMPSIEISSASIEQIEPSEVSERSGPQPTAPNPVPELPEQWEENEPPQPETLPPRAPTPQPSKVKRPTTAAKPIPAAEPRPEPRRPSKAQIEVPPLVDADDDDPEDTSLDAGSEAATIPPVPVQPRRQTGSNKRATSSGSAVKRKTGSELPVARPSSNTGTRPRTSSSSNVASGGMPNAPARRVAGDTARDDSWKDANRSRQQDDAKPKRSFAGTMMGVVVVVGLAVAGFTFKDTIASMLKPVLSAAKSDGTSDSTASGNCTTTLTVDTNVQVHVYVNGELIGDTPIRDYLLPKAGAQRLRLVNDTFALERQVDVTAKECEHVQRREDFATGKVQIKEDGKQNEFDIFIGSAKVGHYPGPPLVLGEGSHELLCRNEPSGLAGKCTVSVKKNGLDFCTVKLHSIGSEDQ